MSATAAAATLAATASNYDPFVLNSVCDANIGLTSSKSSKSIPCKSGMTRRVESSVASAFSVKTSDSILFGITDATNVIPTQDFRNP
ncbi:hypothetical protein [Changpingibacter yushuensis]|uniref:hypothetical protein n=1 Tax=Changpingibacter yushuensis TaxID=2758440 RepID=UPI0015F5235A|nr:hypothetical protein [Changpingibacter yushuensis]